MHDVSREEAEERARAILGERGRRPRYVIDFGAGEGHLVAAFRALGICADGVEISEIGRAAAFRRYGIDILDRLPDGAARDVDLVIVCHTLEHLSDPCGVLRQLADCLAPGGEVLIEVPNVASFEMLRPKWRRLILDLPAHVFHFTPRTLASLLDSAGFVVKELRVTNPEWLEWLFARRTGSGRTTQMEPETPPPHGNGDSPSPVQPFFRRCWRSKVLPWIRAISPGYALKVVAAPRRAPL